ncbi:MAG: hypothetical protein JOY71_11090 [Acetobacteraceae bacterium]|nr:hypothetical protein [Acetobacteraceae bacterium]
MQAGIEVFNDAADALANIPARTPEGRRQKARAALSALMRAGLDAESSVLKLAASALGDVVGRCGYV